MFGAIYGTCKVEMIVPHGVAADTGNILRKPSINHRASRWPWGNVAGDKWESPRRRAVPQVLNGGIVVHCQSVGELLAEQLAVCPGRPNVSVVPAEMVGLCVIRHLHEAAHATSPGAGEKQRNRLRKFEVAVLRGQLWSLRRRERGIEYHRERKSFQKMQAGIVAVLVLANLGLGGKRVAFEFELSAKCIQLGGRVVAERASQSRLPRIAGNGHRLVRK